MIFLIIQAKSLFKHLNGMESDFEETKEEVKLEYDLDLPIVNMPDPDSDDQTDHLDTITEVLDKDTIDGPTTYNCTECKKVFKAARGLEIHYTMSHRDKTTSFPCTHCDQVFEKNYKLKRHIDGTHEKTRIPCPKCSKLFSKSGLKPHMESMHVNRLVKSFKCSQCEFATHALKYLKSHRLTCHDDSRQRHQCPRCQKRFQFPSLLKNHTCNDQQLSTKCDLCDMDFKGPQYLLVHYKKLHKKLPPGTTAPQFLCDICSEAFFRPNALKDHIRRRHLKAEPDKSVCPECHREFSGLLYLSQHYKMVHGGTLPCLEGREKFMCDQCPNVFFAKGSLSLHKDRHHSDQSPADRLKQCPHCELRLADAGSMKEHIQSKHLGLTPFKCDECHRSYGTRQKLQKHKTSMHERQKCNICGQEICNAFILRRHKASVHGIVPTNVHQCEHCPLFFSKETAKIKHCAKHHSDKI
jgi:hypothetical protein